MLTVWRGGCNLPLGSPAKPSRLPAAMDCFAFNRYASKQLALEISESRRDMSWLYMTSICFSDGDWAERLLWALHLQGWRVPTALTMMNLHLDLRPMVHQVTTSASVLHLVAMTLRILDGSFHLLYMWTSSAATTIASNRVWPCPDVRRLISWNIHRMGKVTFAH